MFWPSFLSSFARREWADEVARTLRSALQGSAAKQADEIETVKSIVHGVQSFPRNSELIDGARVALEGSVIHGRRSMVKFVDRPSTDPGCELGDLLMLTTLRIPPGFLRARVCIVQTKGGFTPAVREKFPRYDLSEDQLFLLSAFPEVRGSSGLLKGKTVRFRNLSGMLGAFGFLLPYGDLSVVSARMVRTASVSGKSVDFTDLGLVPVPEVPGWPWFVDVWSSAVSCEDVTELANAWTGFSLGELTDPRAPPGHPHADLLRAILSKFPNLTNLKQVLENSGPADGLIPQDRAGELDRDGGMGVVHLSIGVAETARA